jgi:hypothetical protein
MNQELNDSEDKRAYRISFRLNSCHQALTVIYETLVDREFVTAEQEVRQVISEMKLIIKSMQHDDF